MRYTLPTISEIPNTYLQSVGLYLRQHGFASAIGTKMEASAICYAFSDRADSVVAAQRIMRMRIGKVLPILGKVA